MKRITTLLIVGCLWPLVAATTCFAQMYTVTDLGTLGGTQSAASGINNSGQVVGWALTSSNTTTHAFRTAPNSPINPATDDLGMPPSASSGLISAGINASGQVVGYSWGYFNHGFRTAPNSAINPATDDLGTLGGPVTWAHGINDSGQVVGESWITFGDIIPHAFRTAPNSAINPATDDLGTLAGSESWASSINAFGQVVGQSFAVGGVHAFRTAPNSAINPATDDLGTLGGANSYANAINAFGQVVGWALTSSNTTTHAFRTAPNSPINPATDDLGTLGGTYSEANGIDAFGQVVGLAYTSSNTDQHAFLYSNGVMHDLNELIAAASGLELFDARGINDSGQIAANGIGPDSWLHGVLLTPIYKAFVQHPINTDGSSVFSAKRGVVPVKFTLTQYNVPTCTLQPATITITRAAGGKLASVDESIYSTAADIGSNFRIDPTACQYIYSLAASSLGAGAYLVDISIQGIFVGHAVFALK